MVSQSEPRQSAYDVVVVGSGLGGLSAAAFLSKAGKKVLLVEAQAALGGYAHAFRRGDYNFDPAVHFTAQTAEGKALDQVLQVLGIRDRCNFLILDTLYQAVFPEFSFSAPAGLEAFTAAHIERFPHESAGIREFARVCDQLTIESQQVSPHLSLRELDEAVATFPIFFKYRNSAVGEVLDEHLTDPRLKALLSVTWPYFGLPPSKVGFFPWSNLLMAEMYDGAGYCLGGFQGLVEAFAYAIEQNGGEIVVGNGVSRILVEDGHVIGVVLKNGEKLDAAAVISNANARQTLQEMVGVEHLPAPYLRQLNRMVPSLSAFIVFTATKLDLRQFDLSHEIFVYNHWDHDETHRDVLSGKPGGMWLSLPSLVDDSLAPAGEQIVTITSIAPYEVATSWQEEREHFTELLLAQAEALLPGYRDQITVLEVATPLTMERYTANRGGAIYGWEATPNQTGTKRLARQTPINGLSLASAWSQPGHGSVRVVFSGLLASMELLGYQDLGQFFAAMQRPALG